MTSEEEALSLFEELEDTILVPLQNRNRKVNWWLTADNVAWIDSIYEDCFPLGGNDRHRATFEMVLINLSIRPEPLNILLHKRNYKGETCLPDTFLPSGVHKICEKLSKEGYLNLTRGYKYKSSPGVSSTIEPTKKLLRLVPSSINYQLRKEGLIRVKFSELGELPKEVEEAREVLWEYNKTVEPENMLYATYKYNFSMDGRFTGSSVINLPEEERAKIKINGEPSIEIDISNCMPFIAYAHFLWEELSGDAYDILGLPRKLVKKAMIIALNCEHRWQAIGAIRGEINKKYGGKYDAEDVLQQIENKHPDMEGYFFESVGGELMNIEARCMCKFLKSMLALGVKVYPVYDSVVGPVSAKELIVDNLKESFTVNGIVPEVDIGQSALLGA